MQAADNKEHDKQHDKELQQQHVLSSIVLRGESEIVEEITQLVEQLGRQPMEPPQHVETNVPLHEIAKIVRDSVIFKQPRQAQQQQQQQQQQQ